MATTRPVVLSAMSVLVLVGGAPAAHAHPKRSTPPDGTRLERTPTEVGLGFTEPLEPAFISVEVDEPDGERLDKGGGRVAEGDPRHLTVGVRPGEPGVHRVLWHAASVDTQKRNGTSTLEVAP